MAQKANIIVRGCSSLLFFLFILPCFNRYSFAADLDDLYKPLLKKNQFLYENRGSYFRLKEDGGYIGNYESFDADPHLYSLENNLTFSPVSGVNLGLGFTETFPASYDRDSYNGSGGLVALQEFDLDYVQDYMVDLRLRGEEVEIYLKVLKKLQKAHWDWEVPPAPKFYFTDIYADYENCQLGFRHVLEPHKTQNKTDLSKMTSPLVSDKQVSLEAELEYTKAKVKRNSEYQTVNWYYNFYHRLEDKFAPSINVKYGLSDKWEIKSGLLYTMPFKYIYEDRVFYADGTSRFRVGEYELFNNFFVPLASRYRIKNNCELKLSCDFHYIEQKLARRQKETDNTITVDPIREVRLYNAKPEIKFIYLHEADEQVKDDEFSSLTKSLLCQNQLLLEFLYQYDITRLRRNSDSRSHNIIDPYNVFLHPLDYFMVTTEYAAFFTGNSSNFATNIMPQNYHLLKTSLKYGVTNALDAGISVGYQSSSKVDHATLHDLKNRSYKFKPYYFFDCFFDWRLTDNTLLSFWSHFVPEYKTAIDIEGFTKEFESKSRYFECSAALKVLF